MRNEYADSLILVAVSIFYQGAVAAASVVALILPSFGSLAPEITGTKCAKVGTFRTAKLVKYQCQKSTKGLRWVVASSKSTATKTTAAPTTTTTLAPLYLDAEITDASKMLAAQECRIKDATFNSGDGSGTRA